MLLCVLAVLLVHSQAVRYTSDAEVELSSGQECTDYELAEFRALFNLPGDGKMVMKAYSGPAFDAGNAVYIYPSNDGNGAFEVDNSFLCYRMLSWFRRPGINSVHLQRVDSPMMAQAVLEQFPDRSVQHLVLGGHGNGLGIHFGNHSKRQGALKAQWKSADEMLEVTGRKLAAGASLLLDSCLAGTLHVTENIAEFVARSVARTAPDGVRVFSAVHSLWSSDLEMHFNEDGEFQPLVLHGGQVFNVVPEAVSDRDVGPGDWVRAYYKLKEGMSDMTAVGMVRSGTSTTGEVTVTFLDSIQPRAFSMKIPMQWLTQVIHKGDRVRVHFDQAAVPKKEPGTLEEVVIDKVTGSPLAMVLLDDGRRIRSPVRKILSGDSPIKVTGNLYPAVGDLAVAAESEPIEVGVVVAETFKGARMYFADKIAAEAIKDVKASKIPLVLKSGSWIRVSVPSRVRASNFLVTAEFLKADETGAKVNVVVPRDSGLANGIVTGQTTVPVRDVLFMLNADGSLRQLPHRTPAASG